MENPIKMDDLVFLETPIWWESRWNIISLNILSAEMEQALKQTERNFIDRLTGSLGLIYFLAILNLLDM